MVASDLIRTERNWTEPQGRLVKILVGLVQFSSDEMRWDEMIIRCWTCAVVCNRKSGSWSVSWRCSPAAARRLTDKQKRKPTQQSALSASPPHRLTPDNTPTVCLLSDRTKTINCPYRGWRPGRPRYHAHTRWTPPLPKTYYYGRESILDLTLTLYLDMWPWVIYFQSQAR